MKQIDKQVETMYDNVMRHAHPSIIIIVVLFVYSAISLIKCQTVC